MKHGMVMAAARRQNLITDFPFLSGLAGTIHEHFHGG
jgi:hypothetical protein